MSWGVAGGRSIRVLATARQRGPSTVRREIGRHGGARSPSSGGCGRGRLGQRGPAQALPARHQGRLRGWVARKLCLDGSPEHISGWLEQKHAEAPEMRISHGTIDRSLFVQARGVLEKELLGHLRSKRTLRRSRHATRQRPSRGRMVDAVSIRERPAGVEDHAIPGHWEGDRLAGGRDSHVATRVERQPGSTTLVKLKAKTSREVVHALNRKVRQLPQEREEPLTWDRGLEMGLHKDLSVATNMKVAFCDSRSPWARGTDEKTNRLLRQ
jgi:IS30 family transposase